VSKLSKELKLSSSLSTESGKEYWQGYGISDFDCGGFGELQRDSETTGGSRQLTHLTERTRSLLLSQTVSAWLAHWLLDCGSESMRIDKVFTHDEIAQMICSSRVPGEQE